MHWVIRVRETGEIREHCPTVAPSEIEAHVAALNRGELSTGDKRSWGRLKRASRRVSSVDTAQLSVTQWAERLVGDPRTSGVLRPQVGRSFTLAQLRGLLRDVDEADRSFDNRLLDAISKHLERYFGVRRSIKDLEARRKR